MLEIKNYTLEYVKGKKAVDDISLKVNEGDIFGFVGSNGAGKSTTIKSIVGINHITKGDILIDDISIKKNPLKYKERIAYIPDEPAVYENISGIEYLCFIADLYDISYEERNKAIVAEKHGRVHKSLGRKGLKMVFQNGADEGLIRKMQMNGWWWSKANACWYNRDTKGNRRYAQALNELGARVSVVL